MAVTVVIVGNRKVANDAGVANATVVTVDDIEDLHARIAEGFRADAMFVMGSQDPALCRLDDLGVRWVHVGAAGTDGLTQHVFDGRTVTCGRGVSAVPIAEFVLASILAFEKRFPDTWLERPPDRWASARLGELATKSLGIIGLGGIGTAIAQRALAFDMDVVAIRRSPRPSPIAGIEIVGELEDLLSRVDHLAIAAPATPATEHLIDARTLQAVKPGIHLVNIARGTLIDQDALRVALDDGRVALASLDVTDPEPLPEGHWMYHHPAVHLSAHVSWSSPQASGRLVGAFVDNLHRFVAGEPLDGIVQAEHGY
jgi:phosphoglycerate dehydrogenase-like enzyme